MTDTENLTHFDQLYPGRFLKAGDVSERPTLTIVAIHMEELINEKGPKQAAIIRFGEDKRELVLNKTNGMLIRAMFGPDLANWRGKKLTLYREDKVQFGAKTVSAVRVYGSPDIGENIPCEVKHPKKKAQLWTLHATGAAKAPVTPKPAAKTLTDEQRAHVTGLRQRMAGIIRGDQEEEDSAIKRATEQLGAVKASTYDADCARMLGLIVQAQLTAGGGS